MSKIQNYRPEIDGLRAIAVLPVILFHAGVVFVQGGYLGVDVFFVISGYLITNILIKELQSDSFSVLNFYERRARRILPALFVVMLFTVPFAAVLMPPDALQLYFQSLPATAWFASNVHFFRSQSYFGPDAELQPLFHTWSLAVEEQYYLIFPILLALLWRYSKNVGKWLAVSAVVGFIVCVWQWGVNVDAAFYLPHARIWELLAGAILSATQANSNRLTNISVTLQTILTTISAVVLLTCFCIANDQWTIPWLPNLLVVVATVVILALANVENLVGKMLTTRPLVAVGLISYSAYLWHHPLLAFARLSSLNEPSSVSMLALATLSLPIAYLSWRWIERPFRKKGLIAQKTIFVSALSFMLITALGGSLAAYFNLAVVNYTPDQLALVQPVLSKAENCDWKKPFTDFPELTVCDTGGGTSINPVVLWGDSHAAALNEQLSRALKKSERSGIYLGSSPCLRIPGIVTTSRKKSSDVAACKAIQAAMFDFLISQKPSAIIVNMRWTMRLFPVSGAEDNVGFDNGEGGIESEDYRINWSQDVDGQWSTADHVKSAAVVSFLHQLSDIAPIIVVGPVPEVGWHIGERNFKTLFIGGTGIHDISTGYERFLARNAVVIETLNNAQNLIKFTKIDPSDIFCDSFIKGRCVAQFAGTPYYADDDHVSTQGAALIVEEVMANLPPPSTSKP